MYGAIYFFFNPVDPQARPNFSQPSSRTRTGTAQLPTLNQLKSQQPL